MAWKSAPKATSNNKCINSRLAVTIEHGACFTNMCHAREREHPERHGAIRLALRRFRRLPDLMSSLRRVPRLDPRFRGDDTCSLGRSRCSSCFETSPNSFVSFQKGKRRSPQGPEGRRDARQVFRRRAPFGTTRNDGFSFGRRGLDLECVGEAVAARDGDEVVERENFEAAHDGESVLRIGVACERPGGRVGEALAVPNGKRCEQSSARRVPDLDGDVGGSRRRCARRLARTRRKSQAPNVHRWFAADCRSPRPRA